MPFDCAKIQQNRYSHKLNSNFFGVSLTFGLRLVTEHHEVANHEVLATECQRSAAIPPNMPQIVTVRRAILWACGQ